LPVSSLQLLVTGYWLLVTGYWLLAVNGGPMGRMGRFSDSF
jgi:hypothetical protein